MQAQVSAVSSDELSVLPAVGERRGNAPTNGNFSLATRQYRGGHRVTALTSPAQNNPHAKVSYFGVAYFDSL